MPWKTDESGNFVKDDSGNPVFVMDGGEERNVDFPAMYASLSSANRESAERKERLREMEKQVKAWEGIDDIPAFIATARKDAEAVKAMTDQQRSSEEAATMRVQAATAPLEKRIAELEAERQKLAGQFHSSLIRNQFGTSKYVLDELASPALAQDLFARHFSVDDNGNIVAKDSAGNVIYDDKGPAGFDLALRKLVTDSPHRAFVLKGGVQSGSDARTGTPGAHVVDWQKLTATERLEKARAAGLK